MDIDKSVIGLTSEKYVVEVEKGHIKRIAEAICDLNPIYHDEVFAYDAIYGGIIAPPSFHVALTCEGGELSFDLDMKRMLHGEQEFIYERVIHAGDKIHCQMTVTDLYEKEGK